MIFNGFWFRSMLVPPRRWSTDAARRPTRWTSAPGAGHAAHRAVGRALDHPHESALESIATRVVVPRDVNREAYNVKEDHSTPVQPTDMDERIVLPAAL